MATLFDMEEHMDMAMGFPFSHSRSRSFLVFR